MSSETTRRDPDRGSYAEEQPPSAAELDGIEALFPLCYAELRSMAHRQLRAEESGHTLDTTSLVHEAYLRLAPQSSAHALNARQLFALAARAMRRVLVDYARRHRALRRGGGVHTVALDVLSEPPNDASIAEDEGAARAEQLLALDAAIDRLEREDERLARVVELRFYAGLTEGQIAELLGVTERTVRRDWARAREWLHREVMAQLK